MQDKIEDDCRIITNKQTYKIQRKRRLYWPFRWVWWWCDTYDHKFQNGIWASRKAKYPSKDEALAAIDSYIKSKRTEANPWITVNRDK